MAASIHCLRCLALALLLSCLGTCCSARSLSSTGAGVEPATTIRRLQQQEQQADCPQCTSCPNVYGYTGYRNARPLGEDVMQGDTPMRAGSVTLPQLAQLCNHSCTCEAFSSAGSFKTSANMSANSLTDDSCFYVRNNPPLPCSDCPPVPGYRAYPSYDHYWDDLSTKLPKVFNLSDIASLCDEDCACKGFNVFSWSNAKTFDTANKKSLVFPMHSSAWTGAYFCLYEKLVLSVVCPDDTCPEAPGYTATRGVDHEGDNLHVATNLYDRVVDGTGSGSPDMAFMCNSSCTCRGFSSAGDGYLKTNATPNANSTGTCLYQRIAPPPACPVCPALDGFDAVVGYDTVVGYDPTPGYSKPVALLDVPLLLNTTSLAAAGALCLQDCRCRGLSFNTSLSADALAANFSAAVSLKSLAMPMLPAQGMCFYVRQGVVNFCTALPPTPANVTGSTSSSSSSSDSGSSSHTAAIVGGVVGGVLGAVLLAAAIIGLVLWRRKSKRGGGWFSEAGKPLMPAPSSHALGKLHKSLHLPPGDGFLMDIAPYFTWLDTTPADAYPLEAGVTAPEADTEEVVQLSGVQVMQELELLADGMLGKGATAMVFKCRMPKRFGPQALLAAKVMRVAQGAELQYMMSSFEYEAELLKRCRHPGVVRLYGYCLEPPCACLIMELLPTSLKDRLHGLEPGQQANFTTTVGKGSLTSPTKHTTTTTTTTTTVTVTGMDTQRTAMSGHDNTIPYNEQTNRGRDRDASTTFSSTANATPFGVDAELQKYDSGLNKYDSGVLSPASLASPVTARVHTLRSRRMSCVSSIVTSYGAPLSMLEVLQLSTNIAAGLAHLHAKPSPEEGPPQEDSKAEHVVHRDLKPANILLNSLGQAKITDFGLARGHQNTTVYTDHVGAGTLRYMAPEIITSGMDSKLTNKVDIYSLGIMMWELTAHQRPWPGCTEANIPLLVTSGQRPATPGYPPADGQAPAATPTMESLQEPATFSAVPAYTALIHECWDADSTRRPDAASVHRRLKALLEELHIDLDQDMSPNDV